MMKKLLILVTGILSSLFVGCEKVEPDNMNVNLPENLHYKEFGMLETKATTVSWVEGDKICVYSLGENDIILYKDTVDITDINRNAGKIKALVDDRSEEYFAVYPYNAIRSEIGEALNDEDFNINMSGKFSDVSVMTQYIGLMDTDIYMENRFALLELNTRDYYGTVKIDSSFPSESSVPKTYGTYWIPISHKNETITLTITTKQGWSKKNIVQTAIFKVKPGSIYTK